KDGGHRWVFRIIAGGKYNVITSTEDIELGKWVHVAALINADQTMALFVNGKRQGPSIPVAGMRDVVPYLPCRIGGEDIGRGTFVGEFRAVRLSHAARYDKDFVPTTRFETDRHTSALYHFDEGEGNVLRDRSGRAIHGSVTGGRWVKVP